MSIDHPWEKEALSTEGRPAEQARAWWLLLLPAAYLLHLAEEWWGGEGFAQWTARTVGSPVSTTRFLVLNGIVWPLFSLLTVTAILRAKWVWFIATFATVVLINAGLHALGTLVTSTYSPGLLTSLFLYLPLGLAAISYSKRVATPRSFSLAVLLGLLIHAVVAVIAFT